MSMNLTGSLEVFGLDEILALIGMGGRTGHMVIASPGAVGEVHLVDGEVSAASADCARAGLLRRLVGAAPVPVGDVGAALEAEDPVRALVDAGHVDVEVARGIARDHALDALGEMLAWDQGAFEVSVGTQGPGDIQMRLPVNEAVDLARSRMEQWDRLRQVLPDDHTVLDVVPKPGEVPSLDLDDWAVLARIDGHRTLAQVVAAAGCPPIAASERLASLMERGLVEAHSAHADSQRDELDRLLAAFERQGPAAASAVPAVHVAPDPVQTATDPVATAPEEWDGAVVPLPFVGSVPAVAEGDPGTSAEGGQPAQVLQPSPTPEVVALEPDLEWSPWTQALGLTAPASTGEWVEDPLAGPGIAEMIAGAAGMLPVAEAPLPVAPAWPAAQRIDAPVDGETYDALVPGPRAAPWDAAQPGIQIAGDAVPSAERADPDVVPALAPAAAQAEDPLAGGLLAQLISGVRGL